MKRILAASALTSAVLALTCLRATAAPAAPGNTLCVYIPPVYVLSHPVTPQIGVCVPAP